MKSSSRPPFSHLAFSHLPTPAKHPDHQAIVISPSWILFGHKPSMHRGFPILLRAARVEQNGLATSLMERDPSREVAERQRERPEPCSQRLLFTSQQMLVRWHCRLGFRAGAISRGSEQGCAGSPLLSCVFYRRILGRS